MSQHVGHDHFRADHVGSLLRPDALKAARDRLEGDHHKRVRGSRRFAELEPLENAAIREAVALQERAGLHVITDGEFRRRSWWQDYVLEHDGTFIDFAEFGIDFTDPKGHKLPAPVAHCDGRIRRVRGFNTDAFKYLRGLTAQTPKVTMPAPPVFHFFGGRRAIDPAVYPALDRFWADIALAYRQEIAELAALGCRYVQLDECILVLMCDPKFKAQLAARGDDPDRLLATYIDAINLALADRPPGVLVGMHLCRGNNRGHWLGEGGYDWIADALFNRIDVDRFLLEYDSPRAGDFTPLRHLPKGKTAVLGLVTTKSPKLETADELKRRIEDAARHAPIDQLCLSPQCGFASHFMGNPLSVDDERRKLELVVRVAGDVWRH